MERVDGEEGVGERKPLIRLGVHTGRHVKMGNAFQAPAQRSPGSEYKPGVGGMTGPHRRRGDGSCTRLRKSL